MTAIRFPSLPVLLVDDELQALQSFDIALRSSGINNLLSCQDSEEVLPLADEQEIEVVLLDLWMPRLSGEEILAKFTEKYPDVPLIIVTGVNDAETAVRCIRSGAFDYLVKPIDRDRLVTTVGRAIEVRELRRENSRLKEGLLSPDLKHAEAFTPIVHMSPTMRSVLSYVEAIAGTAQPVLITGETGVGKELIARAIHAISRSGNPFVPVNAAGLDDNVFADTLFGHAKGAFTGAEGSRAGLVQQASGGTLFLDEIGDLSVASQVKLLRLLQEREYFPLGSDLPKRTDTRIVVATNQDVHALLQSCKLRKDLYFRLHTHHVHVPPLRERMEDLPVLVEHFLAEAAESLGKKKPTPPRELPSVLNTYDFPGNIRELRAMVIDAVSGHDSGVLSLQSFRDAVGIEAASPRGESAKPAPDDATQATFSHPLPTLKQVEELLIEEALRRCNGNQSVAAPMLGISRQALNRRIRRMRE